MIRSVVIVGSSILVALGLIGLWALSSRPPAEERAPIEYVEGVDGLDTGVEVDQPGIATAENFVGNRIRVVEGTLRNTSDRLVRSVELQLTFEDREGEIVHEESGEALRSALPAGETRRYEYRFENLPDTWNLRRPTVTVGRVGF